MAKSSFRRAPVGSEPSLPRNAEDPVIPLQPTSKTLTRDDIPLSARAQFDSADVALAKVEDAARLLLVAVNELRNVIGQQLIDRVHADLRTDKPKDR